MPSYTGTMQNGELMLPPIVAESRRLFLTGVRTGSFVKETLMKVSVDKSHQQIKTIFGLVIATILENFEENGYDSSYILGLDKPTGIPVSKELLKEYLYNVCPIYDDDGKRITLSKASMAQAAKFIDDCRNWASSQWGIFIPDPQKDWRQEKR